MPRSPSWNRTPRGVLAAGCAVLLLTGEVLILAQETTQAPKSTAAAEPAATKIPAEQLDPLLAQTLVGSTYPLAIVQLQQWMAKNEELKDKAPADAVAKQPWDPSIQSMTAVPEVVKRLADDLQWTTDLGNAFLEEQRVETKIVEEKTVIVYGQPVYLYPPIYYPPDPPGTAFVTFSMGVMMGAAIWGGSCCGCGWGHSNNLDINVNNSGVVYQKDLGAKSVEQFRAMERFNPDPTWKPVATP